MEFEQQLSRPSSEQGTGKLKHLESVIELAGVLGQQTDFQEILRFVCSRASTILNANSATVMMLNPRTYETIKTIVTHEVGTGEKRAHVLRSYVVGWVLKHNQSFLSADIKSDPRLRKNLFEGTAIHSVMGAPLVSGGTTIGCLLVMDERVNREFTADGLSVLEKLAAICAPFVSNVQRIQEYFHVHLPL